MKRVALLLTSRQAIDMGLASSANTLALRELYTFDDGLLIPLALCLPMVMPQPRSRPAKNSSRTKAGIFDPKSSMFIIKIRIGRAEIEASRS
jgi:hypothetical protein